MQVAQVTTKIKAGCTIELSELFLRKSHLIVITDDTEGRPRHAVKERDALGKIVAIDDGIVGVFDKIAELYLKVRRKAFIDLIGQLVQIGGGVAREFADCAFVGFFVANVRVGDQGKGGHVVTLA